MTIKPLTWVLVAGLAVGTSSRAETPAEQWGRSHEAAKAAFEAWARSNTKTARRLVTWDEQHPLRSQFFWKWAIAHPDEKVAQFIAQYPDWPAVHEILEPRQAEVDGLVSWIHAHPAATRELVAEPGRFAQFCRELFPGLGRSDAEVP